MSILSDSTLKERISKGELILNGDPAKVKFCAYHFTAEKIFPAGTNGAEVVDWSTPPDHDAYIISPGSLVWIRTRGIVQMPPDLSAFYWQTNGLSQKGLMLVNTSMVEPGYKGSLSCLFVNFGRLPVVIFPTTTLAKIIFLQLDRCAANPSDLKIEPAQYDRDLRSVALLAPPSFLQVSELTRSIEAERDRILTNLTKEADAIRNEAGNQVELLQDEADKIRNTTLEEFRKDTKGALIKVFGYAAVGVVLAILLMNLASLVQNKIRPNMESDIRDQVEAEVRRRAAVTTAAETIRRDSLQAATLTEVRAIRARADSLEARLQRVEGKRPK